MKHYRDPVTGLVYGYEIDGSQDEFIPAGYVRLTDEELAAHVASYSAAPGDVRRDDLLAELAAVDAASARPLRAIVAGTATDEDRARLVELEEQATALRAELEALQAPVDPVPEPEAEPA